MRSDHKYSNVFYNYIEKGALSSAEILFSRLLARVKVESVVDLGCGRGAWLSVAKKMGVKEIWGLDGDYVDQGNLLIDRTEFTACNLAGGIESQRRYDLAMSLEVAEHLPAESAESFVDNLVKLSDVVLFSAAVVGQGGEHHVNEQPLEFWKEKFEERGYSCFDFLRKEMRAERAVMPWYKNNTLVYANIAGQRRLSAEVLNSMVPRSQDIESYGSPLWRMRLFVFSFFPSQLSTLIAQGNSLWTSVKARLHKG